MIADYQAEKMVKLALCDELKEHIEKLQADNKIVCNEVTSVSRETAMQALLVTPRTLRLFSFVRMSMIVLDVRAKFMQPDNCHHPGGPIQLSREVERTGDSELVCALPFDSRRHSRMPQMEPFPSCQG